MFSDVQNSKGLEHFTYLSGRSNRNKGKDAPKTTERLGGLENLPLSFCGALLQHHLPRGLRKHGEKAKQSLGLLEQEESRSLKLVAMKKRA